MNSYPSGVRRESFDSVLAKNLVVARRAAGLTQQALANAANISRATIAQVEAGFSDPRLSTIVDLSTAIGISPVLLLSGDLELSALTEMMRRTEPATVSMPAQQLRQMSYFAQTGLLPDRVRAARIGADAAHAAGRSPAAIVGAAIGSALIPGDGTATGALFAELSASSEAEETAPTP